MRVFKDLNEWQQFRKLSVPQGIRIGFVPTMGALHAGHGSLLKKAREESDVVVLSIYVNPTQFDNKQDLAKYPSTLDADLVLAESLGCDHVILPDYQQIYPDDFRYKISEKEFSLKLCGAHRPGHFDGVLTVVMKLFQLVRPQKAYFGEKDFQQLQLIQSMSQAFFLDVDVVACPTVRENDGLAMSSRNVRLDPESRARAALFPKILNAGYTAATTRLELEKAGFQVDYVEDHGERRFGAVFIGGVRLIDNVPITSSRETPTRKLKVLITAGGTKTEIDSVRAITNTSSGSTSARIAEGFASHGHDVTYVHAQGAILPAGAEILLRNFVTYDDLNETLKSELAKIRFDAVIHAAAVSDYAIDHLMIGGEKVMPGSHGKVESAQPLSIHLKKTAKILPLLKSYADNPKLIIVGFKLTSGATKSEKEKAVARIAESADLVVQNDLNEISGETHVATLYRRGHEMAKTQSKSQLAETLERVLLEMAGEAK